MVAVGRKWFCECVSDLRMFKVMSIKTVVKPLFAAVNVPILRC